MELNDFKIYDNEKIDEYLVYIDEVKKNMTDSSWLGDFTKEDILSLIGIGSHLFIFMDDDKIACSCFIIPASKKDILKFGLDVDSKLVIDYGPQVVNSNYVGNGLQRKMINFIDEYSVNNGYKYACSTVHPDNFYSSSNLIKSNFKKIGTKDFSRGIRDIYFKEF